MTVSVVTADDVIALAKSIKSLSEGQMKRISDLVAFMDDEDLKILQEMLLKVQEAEIEDMKREMEARTDFASKYMEYKSGKMRTEMKKKENVSQAGDTKEANDLLVNL